MKAVALLAGVAIVTATGIHTVKRSQAVAPAAMDSLPSPAAPGSGEPNLAVASNGDILLSWLEPGASGHSLKLARLAGGKWSSPSVIRSGNDFWVNWADFPSVAVLRDGRLSAHWLQRTGKATYAYGVRVALSQDNGATWGKPITPHRDSSQAEHGFVAMWPEGNGLGAVWLDGRKNAGGHEGHGETMLMASTISRDGKLGAEQIVDARTCDCCANAVAMAAAGPVVAYRNRSAEEIRDIYVTRRVGGKWQEGVPVHADNWKINACPVNGPAIVANGNNVAVAWFTGARDTNKVSVVFSTDGGATFGAATRVDGGEPGGRVGLVLLDDGSALVSWLERTGGDVANVQARTVRRDGKMGPVRVVATSSSARASGVPKMIRRGDDVFFAWTVAAKPSTIRVAHASQAYFR